MRRHARGQAAAHARVVAALEQRHHAPAAAVARARRRGVQKRARREPKVRVGEHHLRERVAREHGDGDPWNVKYARGGLVDLEFLCAYLLLRHAHRHPDILNPNTNLALRGLEAAGLLAPNTVAELIETGAVLRNAQALLRLCLSGGATGDSGVPEGLMALLARCVGAVNANAIEATLLDAEARVHHHYRDIIAGPAAALRPAEAPG